MTTPRTVKEWLPDELKRQAVHEEALRRLIREKKSRVLDSFDPTREEYIIWAEEATIEGRQVKTSTEEGEPATPRRGRARVLRDQTGQRVSIPDEQKMGLEKRIAVYDAGRLRILDPGERAALRRSRQRQRTRVLRQAA